MPFTLDRYAGFPGVAASNIPAGAPVKLAGSGNRAFVQATIGDVAFGVLDLAQGAATAGDAITVKEQGAVVEAIAGASLGQGPVTVNASGLFVPVAGASGALRTCVGEAVSTAAAAGEHFSLYVRPRVLSLPEGGSL